MQSVDFSLFYGHDETMSTATHNLPTVSLGELRKEVGNVVNRAAFAGERTAVTRHGKTVAAIVSVDDLELLDELERRVDLEALRQARREDDGTRVSLDEFLATETTETPDVPDEA